MNEGRKTGALASNREGARDGGVCVERGEAERRWVTGVRGVWGGYNADFGVPGSPDSPGSGAGDENQIPSHTVCTHVGFDQVLLLSNGDEAMWR